MKARARRWIRVQGVITAVIVLPLGVLGVIGLRNESRLADEGRSLCAPLTASRIIGGRRVSHELKYELTLAGRTYRASDATGRDDLWQSVPEREWHRAVATTCVDVLYLPDDPGVNRPARTEASNDPVANKIASLALCALFLGMFGASTWRIAVVDRTRRWQIAGHDDESVELVAGAERRRILLADVHRARRIVLPRAQLHPPWRFESDVLELRTRREAPVVVFPGTDGAFAAVLERLERRGLLRTRRAS